VPLPNQFGFAKNPNAAKEAAAKAAREAATAAKAAKSGESHTPTKYVSPDACSDRTRIVFDDSYSMSDHIKDAKDGVVEFFRNCIPNQTACAVHFLDTDDPEKLLSSLQTNLPALGGELLDFKLAMGGTPLYTRMNEVIQLQLTRMVAFTDGSPTDTHHLVPYKGNEENQFADADVIIAKAVEKKVPIDTVFFGSANSTKEIELLKYFAEKTGGYFLHFDPAKVNFATAFKYLAPVNRLMLASESVRKEIESGKRN